MKTLLLFAAILILASTASAAEPFVVIVRHAEKADNDPKDPDLSPAGRARAQRLAEILKKAGITAIFTTEFKRTQETALPMISWTGISETVVAGKDPAPLVSKLKQLNGNALVISHGNTIPDLIKALGIETAIQIPDDDYSDLFVVTLGSKPQLLRLRYPQ